MCTRMFSYLLMVWLAVVTVTVSLITRSDQLQAATREFSILPSQNANATFMVKKCIISFLCAFNLPIDNENCTLQFSEDATYNNLSAPIQVPPNSPFTLRAIPLNKVFYYQVVVSTNGSTIFQQRSNFTPLYNGEDIFSLAPGNQALLVIGVSLLGIAFALSVVWIRAKLQSIRKPWLSLVLLVIGIVVMVISVFLWVSLAFQVGLERSICDISWQSTRDNLIITAHFFSDLAFVVVLVSLLMLYCKVDDCIHDALASYFLSDLYYKFRKNKNRTTYPNI